jgi:hypothetical protein
MIAALEDNIDEFTKAYEEKRRREGSPEPD